MLQTRELPEILREASLPSLPHVLLEIYELLHSEVAGAEEMVRLLESDAGLTARTLRLANSAYYGHGDEVTQVTRAVLRIGPFDLWWLLFTTEVKGMFFGIDSRLMDMERFWRHSLFTACAARELSGWRQLGRPGDLFVAGLLHDVGKLLLLHRLPVEYGEVLAAVAEGGALVEQEQRLLGFSHADIGGLLLAHWQMPDLFVRAAERHHREPGQESEEGLVATADRLAHEILEGAEGEVAEGLEPALVRAVENDYRALVERIL